MACITADASWGRLAGVQRQLTSATRATQVCKIDGAARDVRARVHRRTSLPLRGESYATGAISVVAGAADGTEELEMVVVCRKGDGEGRSRADWEEDSAG